MLGANRWDLGLNSDARGSYLRRFCGDRDELGASPRPYHCMARERRPIGECPRLSNQGPRFTVIVMGAIAVGDSAYRFG